MMPFARTPPPPPDAVCCGQHPPGVAGGPLVLACQLCATSPTYWRVVKVIDRATFTGTLADGTATFHITASHMEYQR